MKIAIGCDHTAIGLKNHLMEHLAGRGIEVIDTGAYSEERTHYPIYAKEVAQMLQNNQVDLGVLVCGTGIGMSIAANKFDGIRACACSDTFSARASRGHNDSNILCMGQRVVGYSLGADILDAWLDAEYEGGRHQMRVDMIADFEKI